MRFTEVVQKPHLRGLAIIQATSHFLTLLPKEVTASMFELAMRKNVAELDLAVQVNYLHDYCDANQVMLEAMGETFIDFEFDPGNAEQAKFMNDVFDNATRWCALVWR